jgi:hypothetical protein
MGGSIHRGRVSDPIMLLWAAQLIGWKHHYPRSVEAGLPLAVGRRILLRSEARFTYRRHWRLGSIRWPNDELHELAADIKERGLLQPIILDAKGRIFDGRNRLAACEIVGVEPQFETYEGDDTDGYA